MYIHVLWYSEVLLVSMTSKEGYWKKGDDMEIQVGVSVRLPYIIMEGID